jgi:hypothetical protein
VSPAPAEAASGPAPGIAATRDPFPAHDRTGAAVAAPPSVRAGLGAAWAGSLLALALLGWGMVVERQQMMRLWPPSTRLYAALGLYSPGQGR